RNTNDLSTMDEMSTVRQRLISLLIEHGADLNQEDKIGCTPLTCAIQYHGDNIDTYTCIKLISTLIKHGADINGINKFGDTPLTLAVQDHGDNIDTFCHQYFTVLNGL
ncbi:ankyrin repeat domain-containing protein 54-like, partial [Patella vulgata]|uniref:ankyrin repeat domain-containing protein 54-like n=1 Tax=Patella vulgata TaxID=6465 RepID=UPI0024A8BBB8